MLLRFAAAIILALTLLTSAQAQPPGQQRQVSGIYPHLAMFNEEGECGTGAVVPWAGRLWVVTYAPHKPKGSTDKLYEIGPDLTPVIRPESIGGTPANRFIHQESKQLFIGPYVINEDRDVRVLTPDRMFGRLTGVARHLEDPAGKIYFATMEEGFYEVDVRTLAVKELWADEQVKAGRHADLPGYHGKGFYSGQGRMVYSNNGDHAREALTKPDIPSGALAEWDGKADQWTIVRRNQFTEVTGPGGITGNPNPATDPIWAVGWDHRSLLLNVLHEGTWHSYRLPKSSHSYDGAHGWNTEWPRIREIGEDDLLMTMHGAFWRFPKAFTPNNSAGIAPRSNYLKVIGDFCRWGDFVVMGCDDTAKSEFLNKRKLKGQVAGPGQSQSNLWFVKPGQLDALGPVIGRGAVWQNDPVTANTPSDPYLFSGYDRRSLFLVNRGPSAVDLQLEVDSRGTGEWTPLKSVALKSESSEWLDLTSAPPAVWIRLVPSADAKGITAAFQFSNRDQRGIEPDPIFRGFQSNRPAAPVFDLLHVRGANFRTLRAVSDNQPLGADLVVNDGQLELQPADETGTKWVKDNLAPPTNVISIDAASVVYTDDQNRTWRLPRVANFEDPVASGTSIRVCREVCTERDLLNIGGTFFELPAENAGGFAKIRPVSSHGRWISDFATHRGLFVMAGLTTSENADAEHVIVESSTGRTLWLGAVDDLWKFGKPRGVGGPWHQTAVTKNVPSDPYLMTGYDQKTVTLSQDGSEAVQMRLEVDITGNGDWTTYKVFDVGSQPVTHKFPEAFAAYWVRLTADRDCTASAVFTYE